MPTLPLSNRASLVGPPEFSLLKFLLRNSDSYELVPKKKIQEETEFNPTQLDYYLTKLLKLKLIYREKNLGYDAYKITFSGIDVISIKKLYESRILKSLSTIIGEGKESEVYAGYDFDDNKIVIKFHRIGRTSYKSLRRVNKDPYGRKSWVRLSIENAEAEYKALTCMWKNGARVPRPIGLGVNAIAMELIDGVQLSEKPELGDPEKVLDEIISIIKIAYTCCKIIHGDLSPYNIMVTNDIPYIIDWPQSSRASEETLYRDLSHIISFFEKEYEIVREIPQILSYIRG
jgi:RIO kinase 2